MKKLALISLLFLAALSCHAIPNTRPITTETPAEFFRLVKVNCIQAVIAWNPKNFDRWNELYRSYRQRVEEFVANNTLTAEENKTADDLLQQMHVQWLKTLRMTQKENAQHAQELVQTMVKQAEQEATAARIKTILDTVTEKLKAEPARSQTRLDQREGEFYTQILKGKELQESIDSYVASMKKIETYITEFMKKEQLSSQEISRASELLKKAIFQAREAQNLLVIEALPF